MIKFIIERVSIMNDIGLLNLIQKLHLGELIDDECLATFLEQQECYFLLSKMPSQKNRIISYLIVNQMRIISQYEECRSLFEELNNFPYAIIKGAVLSKQIYPSVAYRMSRDIDILISPRNLKEIGIILKQHGFIQGQVIDNTIKPYSREKNIFQKIYTHQLASYVKKTDNIYSPFINVDVNCSIVWGEASWCMNMDSFLENTESFEVFGIKIRKLKTNFEFIALCMHHYKDLNSLYLLSERGIKLSLFYDIKLYVTKKYIDVKELKFICDKLCISEYITFCLYHTNIIFPSDIIEHYLEFFCPNDYSYILNRIGLDENEYKYMVGGVSSWVFDNEFKNKLNSILTEYDKKRLK